MVRAAGSEQGVWSFAWADDASGELASAVDGCARDVAGLPFAWARRSGPTQLPREVARRQQAQAAAREASANPVPPATQEPPKLPQGAAAKLGTSEFGDSYPHLRPQPEQFSPMRLEEESGVVLTVPREAAPQRGSKPRRGTWLAPPVGGAWGPSRRPPTPYRTASRSSAISASWSSTQSPGFLEKTSSFSRCARSRRSSGSIVSAR